MICSKILAATVGGTLRHFLLQIAFISDLRAYFRWRDYARAHYTAQMVRILLQNLLLHEHATHFGRYHCVALAICIFIFTNEGACGRYYACWHRFKFVIDRVGDIVVDFGLSAYVIFLLLLGRLSDHLALDFAWIYLLPQIKFRR